MPKIPFVDYSSIVVGGYHVEASESNSGNSGTSKTIDWSVASAQLSTLTGNVTYAFSNPTVGGSYVLRIATGAGGFTTTWPGSVSWLNSMNMAPGVDMGGSHTLIVSLYYDGTTYWGTYSSTY